LRFNCYPVSLPIFSSLPLAVNPVGVTTYWCYFLQIIVYNFVTIYGITTKFGIRMHPYPDFQCTKFQDNRIMPLCFIATFMTKRRKKKKKKRKTKKISQLLKVHITETPGMIYLKFEMWGDDIDWHFQC